MKSSTLSKPTVGVAFITHTAKHHLPHCLPPLLNSPLNPRVVVVNSSSGDGTVELAKEMGAETLVIPRKEFNHGTTREKARKYLGTDIVVMMTPDAYLQGSSMLEELILPILKKEAAITYARQIPHKGANFFEAFPRFYNYPEKSELRSIEDIKKYGVYTFFCSDSCAAYSNKVLDSIGGFPSVLIGEDTYAVAKALRLGFKVAYQAEAIVCHSHTYSLRQEFYRHFDTGLERSNYKELFKGAGRDEARGVDYVKKMFKSLIADRPLSLFYGVAHCASKWMGYRLGVLCKKAPVFVKKCFTGQDFYWVSDDFLKIKN